MKNVKRNTLLAALFLSATLFISCQEKTNAESAEENLVEAQQDLNDVKTEAQEDAQNLATQAEYTSSKQKQKKKFKPIKCELRN